MSALAYIYGRFVVGHGERPHEVYLALNVMIDAPPTASASIESVYLVVQAARKYRILLKREVALIDASKNKSRLDQIDISKLVWRAHMVVVIGGFVHQFCTPSDHAASGRQLLPHRDSCLLQYRHVCPPWVFVRRLVHVHVAGSAATSNIRLVEDRLGAAFGSCSTQLTMIYPAKHARH